MSYCIYYIVCPHECTIGVYECRFAGYHVENNQDQNIDTEATATVSRWLPWTGMPGSFEKNQGRQNLGLFPYELTSVPRTYRTVAKVPLILSRLKRRAKYREYSSTEVLTLKSVTRSP